MKEKDKVKKTSMYTGVGWHKMHNKWKAVVYRNGNTKYLGYFDTEDEAYLYREKYLRSVE